VETVKISVKQFTILVLMYTMGSSIMNMPAQLAANAQSNAWISSIIGLMVGLMLTLLYAKISAVYPNKTLVEVNRAVFGKWFGTLLSLFILFPVFIISAGNLSEIGYFFTTHVMVETPVHAILILTLVAVIYVIRKGLEVMARSCEIFFPWTAAILLILIIFLLPEVKMENLVPNFVKGIGPIVGAAYPYAMNPYSQLVIFLMILPYVNQVAKARKGLLVGVMIAGFVTTIITVMCLGVLGVDVTARNTHPSYVLGKKISIGGFLERVEVLVALSWIFSTFFRLLVSTFVLILGISQILKMIDIKPLILPSGFLLLVYSMIDNPNNVSVRQFLFETWPAYLLTSFVLLPLLVYIGALIKTKKEA
jgi:spore germination protein KB